MAIKQCAILTMDSLEDFEAYDDLLIEPMAAAGWQLTFVSWRASNVDWGMFDVVLIRSPWDYQDDANAFLKVLEEIDSSSAVLENSLKTVKWNIDKIYLKELEEKGVNIVPTLWREKLDAQEFADFFRHFNGEQIILKPRISANADNTYWLDRVKAEKNANTLSQVFSDKPFMVQPFIGSVIEEGEYSLFYFDGKYSHAILKTPKENDFRVQEEHGGRLNKIEPEAELLKRAEITLHAIGEMPMYALSLIHI